MKIAAVVFSLALVAGCSVNALRYSADPCRSLAKLLTAYNEAFDLSMNDYEAGTGSRSAEVRDQAMAVFSERFAVLEEMERATRETAARCLDEG